MTSRNFDPKLTPFYLSDLHAPSNINIPPSPLLRDVIYECCLN